MPRRPVRYDVRNMTVDANGVQFGETFARCVKRAIGPSRWDGFILIDDDAAMYDVHVEQLTRLA